MAVPYSKKVAAAIELRLSLLQAMESLRLPSLLARRGKEGKEVTIDENNAVDSSISPFLIFKITRLTDQ